MIGALISTALGVGSAVIGGIQASKAAKQANALVDKAAQDNQAWYDRRYNEDATQRADAQRILQLTNEAYKQRNKAAQGAQAVMGGTEESVAATKQANAQGMADAASQIAASAANSKDAIEQQYLANKSNLNNQKIAIENNRAANIASATGQAASAFGNMGEGVDDTDWAKKVDDKFANMWKK